MEEEDGFLGLEASAVESSSAHLARHAGNISSSDWMDPNCFTLPACPTSPPR
jgi:hypothetical protein